MVAVAALLSALRKARLLVVCPMRSIRMDGLCLPISPFLVISLEITFFICGLLFALVVEEWVWDYAVTVTIIHIIITSVVMSEFPLMLHWWLALGSGVISMICGGQILAYCLFKDNFIYPILDDF
ncbi:PREDICTED: transmembrane protein 244 [Cariama cristata]|uniref:transmembrane protein 244 n=1 Tax=Cariama cristata TaxID=54380 RepID=UPI00052050CF|nr:PREDICTED: transmembrane protein 244 [Cariama cristata]